MSDTRNSPSVSDAVDTSVIFSGMAVKHFGGKFEPWSYHPRKLGIHDVEIKISHCGICASDIHTATGGWGGCMYPAIVGHEIIGTITKIGTEAKLHQIGDRVGVGPQVLSCLKLDGSCSGGCGSGHENLCKDMVYTYNSVYDDGEQAQGGYASGIRVHESFVFHIPDNLPSDEAAPLLCAGVTVFAPLKRYKVGKGTRVGVIGIGGLGHLALQFAHALGSHVTAISSSNKKEFECKELGADVHIDSSNSKEFNSIVGKLDVVICTANAKGMDWNKYLSVTASGGVFVLVAIPEEELKIKPASLVFRQVSLVSSIIGSIQDEKDMLEFAAIHQVKAKIQLLNMEQVNEGIQKVEQNDVKFRIVLKN